MGTKTNFTESLGRPKVQTVSLPRVIISYLTGTRRTVVEGIALKMISLLIIWFHLLDYSLSTPDVPAY